MELTINKGERFGQLVIIEEVGRFTQPSGQYQRGFLCLCDCGNKKKVRLSHLRHDRVRSCGCIIGEQHGDCRTLLYGIWCAIKWRAQSKYSERQYYFDKGITVCSEWNKYITFRDWAKVNGYKKGLQIDRIDNSKGYYPHNCHFVTQIENMANRDCTLKVHYKNRHIALKTILREKGMESNYYAIRTRLKRGWADEKAIDTPLRKGNYHKGSSTKLSAYQVSGIKKMIDSGFLFKTIARKYNISSTAISHIKIGKTWSSI